MNKQFARLSQLSKHLLHQLKHWYDYHCAHFTLLYQLQAAARAQHTRAVQEYRVHAALHEHFRHAMQILQLASVRSFVDTF